MSPPPLELLATGDVTRSTPAGFSTAPQPPIISPARAVILTWTSSDWAANALPSWRVATESGGLLADEMTIDPGGRQGDDIRRAVAELRRVSGLTWDELAKLLGVSRRSVHFWASGKPLNAANTRRLFQLVDVLRGADRGSSQSNRAALFTVEEGSTAFDLLVAQKFEAARSRLGKGSGRTRPRLRELSSDAKQARRPLSPAARVEIVSEERPATPRPARAVRTLRNTPRESSE